MNKLNYEQPPFTLSFEAQVKLEPARRLMVLVPNLDADLTVVTHRVWELANVSGTRVKLLGLCNDALEEPSLRRKLVTMSAIVNYGNVAVETEIMIGRNWVEAVRAHYQTGDTVVCFGGQRVGSLQRPLSQILQSNLDVPLYILSGLEQHKNSRSSWLAQIVVWIGFIVIILGFFVLQARIDLLMKDGPRMALLMLTLAAEFWAVWFWNSLFV